MFRALKALAAAVLISAIGTGPAAAVDKVSFGTNWLAQAEHGGFYQAVADGTYKKYGLDVTIRQGGPQAANQSLLVAGKIDFFMGANMLELYHAVEQGIPTVAVAAAFQKDPQVLMAHPDVGFDKFTDLAKAKTILMGATGFASYFQWMKASFPGFRDEQYRPYTFNPAPFIADKQTVQEGYLTSEPYEIQKQTGWTPKVFLLADNGFDTYSTLIEAQTQLVDSKPDLVQRFVDASMIGWYNYLYGDNAAANALIKKDNPEMTDGQIAYSIAKMKEYGIVVSDAAETRGIGCMTAEHQRLFFDEMVKAKVVSASLDYQKAFRLNFVCKGVGKELKH